MRILTLNVLMGGAERFGALCAVAANAKPDVVVLQECFGWDQAKLDAFAKVVGTPSTFLGEANARPSGNRYHVALASKLSHQSARVHQDGFSHCVVDVTLHTSTGPGLRVLGAHFVSGDEDTRINEAKRVLDLVTQDERAVLAGDLNAIARHDPYPSVDELDARFKRAEIAKYGSPPRFDTMDALLNAGFVDALHEKPRDASRWVTARRGKDAGDLVDTRTDYVLLTRAAAPDLVEADVVDVGNASDHHAVLAVLR